MTIPLPSPSSSPSSIFPLLDMQRRVLSRVAANVPLPQVLEDIAIDIATHYAHRAYVSIFLSEAAGKGLYVASSLCLPPHCKQAIESLNSVPIAALSESAAFGNDPVRFIDLATALVGTEHHSLALGAGLMACWTIPIRGTDDQVLGTLAFYLTELRTPTRAEAEMMAIAAQTVALAVERQRFRATFRNREARHRQIVNSATDFAIISTDHDGIITSWNEGAHRILGWREQEIVGQPLHRLFTREDTAAGQPQKEMRAALTEGYATDERWHMKKTGERFWASGQLTPLKDDASVVIGFVKILRDRTEQKHAEMELTHQTRLLGSEVDQRTRERDRIWRNSMDLLLAIGPDGVLRAVNPAWTALLGYDASDLINHHFEPFVHADDVSKTADAITYASQAPLEHLEIRLRHKDGSYRWVAWRAAPEGNMVYANGRDITVEKSQAEQLLRANEARLHLALEAGDMGAWEWNLQTNRIVRLHGMSPAHGLPEPAEPGPIPIEHYMERYVHPDDHEIFKAAMTHAAADGAAHRAEYRVLWPDGSIHWIELRGQTLTDATAMPQRVVGVSIDITKRKRAEQDLKFLAQASAELSSLIDPQSTLDRLAFLAVPFFADWCAIDLLEQDGTLNRVAVAHVDPKKVQLAHQFHRLFPPDPNLSQGIWSIIRTGRAQMVSEVTDNLLKQSFSDPDRLKIMKELGVRSYIGVPLSAHGKTLGAITFFAAESGRLYQAEDMALAEDLARRAAVALENADLYRAVRRSDQAKDIFLATLAHELRNPLAAIVNGLNVAKLAIEDKERVAKYINLIDRQAGQLTRLVDDLMDVSRINTGKIELKKQYISLASVLENAIEASRPHIEAAKHTLTVTLPDEPTQLFADPVRLAQVFSNLLTNAAKYTNEGGAISLSVECASEEFCVRVRDTGVGIAPEMLKGIFKIFTQVTHPLERSQGGLGIGLSLVEGLVKLHGGRVEVSSRGLGHGAEFVVHLPFSAEQEAHNTARIDAESRSAEALSRPKRILVVDDNVDAATTIAEILRMLGHDVLTAHDGLEAVRATTEMSPEIVILDIGLPGVDGYEAARRIRAHEGKQRSVLLIALTGWGQEDDKERAYQAGFDQHWVKPIGLKELQELSRRS